MSFDSHQLKSTWPNPDGDIRFSFTGKTTDKTIGIVWSMEAGHQYRPRTILHPHNMVILRGTGTTEIGGARSSYRPGDVVCFEAGVSCAFVEIHTKTLVQSQLDRLPVHVLALGA